MTAIIVVLLIVALVVFVGGIIVNRLNKKD